MKQIPERTLAIQGLRLLFITDIVFGHASHTFLGGGGAECSFFFVVSGFLFAQKPIPYKEYLWRKAKHIYPPYWICLILLILGFVVKGTIHKLEPGWDILPHIFLVQSWIPVIDAYFFKYLGTSWFLSSLLFCYIVAPHVYKFVVKFKKYIIL
jgi:peptidoglycan/LPS O-acetylase OafA/YrhL